MSGPPVNRSAGTNRRRKLPAHHARWVFPLLLSVLMTCIVSMISTLRSVGPVPDFLSIWLGAWAISLAIAFPTVLVVMPLVRKLTTALVETN